MKLKKIPLEDLLEVLEELYNLGVDYVNISGEAVSPDQDALAISFTKEYVNEEFRENFSEEEMQEIPLNTQDLNDAI